MKVTLWMPLYHYNAFFSSLFLPSLFSPHFLPFSLQFLSLYFCLFAGWNSKTNSTVEQESNLPPLTFPCYPLSLSRMGYSDLWCHPCLWTEYCWPMTVGPVNLSVVGSVDWPDSPILHPSISGFWCGFSAVGSINTCCRLRGVCQQNPVIIFILRDMTCIWYFTFMSIRGHIYL